MALSALALAALPPAGAAGQDVPAPSVYVVVLASGLNVREGPGLDERIVTVVTRGETVCVRAISGDWIEVFSPRGRTAGRFAGFVSRGFVSERRADEAELERVGCAGGVVRPGTARAGDLPPA